VEQIILRCVSLSPKELSMIDAIVESCAGIDVGKKYLLVCVLTGAADQEPKMETRTYGTSTSELERLLQWLKEAGCTKVVMESTGNYWNPIFNVLEPAMKVVLANPAHIKNIPGRKTDVKDCQWLAHLLRHGLVRNSFIPPRPIRELRDLTRRRRQLLAAGTAEKNRVQKVLEDANIKLASVLSDLFGVSGQQMLEALVSGNPTPDQISGFARCRLKQRIPEIQAAVERNRLTDHHRFLLRQSLDHLKFLEQQVLDLDQQIMAKLQPYQKQFELLQTIPGVKRESAATLIAEIGTDMSQFPTSSHLIAWAGVCPGNNESAGKRLAVHARKGNPWLRAMLTQSAWAATRKNNCYFTSRYSRISTHRGSKRAVVAMARFLLIIAYHVLTRMEPYRELGPDYLDERQRTHQIRHHLKRLDALGISVAVINVPSVRPLQP
jgi:transposase